MRKITNEGEQRAKEVIFQYFLIFRDISDFLFMNDHYGCLHLFHSYVFGHIFQFFSFYSSLSLFYSLFNCWNATGDCYMESKILSNINGTRGIRSQKRIKQILHEILPRNLFEFHSNLFLWSHLQQLLHSINVLVSDTTDNPYKLRWPIHTIQLFVRISIWVSEVPNTCKFSFILLVIISRYM